MSTLHRLKSVIVPPLAALLFTLAPLSAKALPVVHITQVEENHDSVRVFFQPFPGAADYRIHTLENPKEVKYAGIIHLFAPQDQHWAVGEGGRPVFPYRTVSNRPGNDKPSRIDVPALNIECNGLDPHQAVHVVIEAVNHIGPSPFSNLATEDNTPRSPSSHAMSKMMSMPMGSKSDSADVMEMLGSNAGPTDDGLYSINGQSKPHVIPQVIARSRAVLVKPTGERALPSVPQARQVVFDTFSSGHIEEIPGTRNTRAGNVSYVMHTDAAWRLDFLNDDIFHSRPFIMNRHYMDVLFDGATPGTSLPLHVAHGAATVTPIQSPDFSGGRMLHVTMEVDAHMDGRRWMAFNLTPHDDPLRNLYIEGGPPNKSNTAFFVQLLLNNVSTNLFDGNSDIALCGALGQAPASAGRPMKDGYDGRGLDNRSRFDMFVTRSRYILFEDGQLIIDQNFPKPLPARLLRPKVYFTHYLYHTSNEIAEVKSDRPWERFWIDLFPYSDERHWDNMGYEVLPAQYASASDDELGRLVRESKNIRVVQADELVARK